MTMKMAMQTTEDRDRAQCRLTGTVKNSMVTMMLTLRCMGVQAMIVIHQHGILHRDLATRNVLVYALDPGSADSQFQEMQLHSWCTLLTKLVASCR